MKQKKPVFLKTFSECTIAELRAMPLGDVFSLFFREVTEMFHGDRVRKHHGRVKGAKKRDDEQISKTKHNSIPRLSIPFPKVQAPRLHLNLAGFTEAMKRVFTIGPVQEEPAPPRVKKPKTKKVKKSETVVFSKLASEEESKGEPQDTKQIPAATVTSTATSHDTNEPDEVLDGTEADPQPELEHPHITQIH